MIAKYPARCSRCGKPITIGVDTYDYESKKSYHQSCETDAGESHGQLADKLGFLDHAEALSTDWPLLLLYERDNRRAGRQQPEASGRDAIRGLFEGKEST